MWLSGTTTWRISGHSRIHPSDTAGASCADTIWSTGAAIG